jgi:hypothetical protein
LRRLVRTSLGLLNGVERGGLIGVAIAIADGGLRCLNLPDRRPNLLRLAACQDYREGEKCGTKSNRHDLLTGHGSSAWK